MGLQAHFNTFHGKIKLGREDDAYKKARVRDDSITADVKAAFRDEGYPVIDDFLLGSHGNNTAIHPLSGDLDIDRALVIDDSQAPENPLDPKKKTLSVLENRGFKKAKIKMPCVVADYLSDNVHIDFPIYKKSGDQYSLAVGKRNSNEQNREWADADPKGLRNWVKDQSVYYDSPEKHQQQYRRLVRYLKRWRDFKFVDPTLSKIYSIGLTVMAKECFVPDLNQEGFPNDLSSLSKTVDNMLNNGYFTCIDIKDDRHKVRVDLPVKPYRDIFDGSSSGTGTQFRNKLKNMLTKLEDTEELNNVREQCKLMRKLFGDDFPVPDLPKTPEGKKAAVYSTSGAVGTSQGA